MISRRPARAFLTPLDGRRPPWSEGLRLGMTTTCSLVEAEIAADEIAELDVHDQRADDEADGHGELADDETADEAAPAADLAERGRSRRRAPAGARTSAG